MRQIDWQGKKEAIIRKNCQYSSLNPSMQILNTKKFRWPGLIIITTSLEMNTIA